MTSVSPRSSVLSRCVPMTPCKEWTVRLEANILPILLVAAVVVSVAVAWIAKDYETVSTDMKWPTTFRSGTLAGVSLLAAAGCTAWVTAKAYSHGDHTARLLLLALAVGVSVCLGVATWLYFRSHDYHAAFYLVVAATLGVLVHTYFCFRHLRTVGVVGMVPAVLVCAFLLWRFWPQDHDHPVTVSSP